jgi:hypothetical protein
MIDWFYLLVFFITSPLTKHFFYASPKHLFYSIFMNQLSVKIQTHPLILNSINDRNIFSFKSNYLLRFKISKKLNLLISIVNNFLLTLRFIK